ncbi:unnamed protein product [Phaeothamnion confervicola]
MENGSSNACDSCTKEGAEKKSGRCGQPSYCNDGCHASGWRGHRPACRQRGEGSAPSASAVPTVSTPTDRDAEPPASLGLTAGRFTCFLVA